MNIKDEALFLRLDEFLSSIPEDSFRIFCPDGICAAWSGECRALSAAHVNSAYGGPEEPDKSPYATSFNPGSLDLPVSLGDNKTETALPCTNLDSGEQLEQWATECGNSVVDDSVWIKPNLNAGYRLVRLGGR